MMTVDLDGHVTSIYRLREKTLWIKERGEELKLLKFGFSK
jgi:hypothetical protein